MFQELAAVMCNVTPESESFLKSDTLARSKVVQAHVLTGTITSKQIKTLFEFKLVVASEDIGAAAIAARSAGIFREVVAAVKRGYGLIGMLFDAVREVDDDWVLAHNQLVQVRYKMVAHGICVPDATSGNSRHAMLMRRVAWRTAAVKPLLFSNLVAIAGQPGGAATEDRAPKRVRTGGATAGCGYQRTQDALRSAICDEADACLSAVHIPSLDLSFLDMGLDWTRHVAMRTKPSRMNHPRFFDHMEAGAMAGGVLTAQLTARMIQEYMATYPTSYAPCATVSADPNNVRWGCTRMTVRLSDTLVVAWGGALRIAYCGLLKYRIDWIVLALLLLPAGPSHPHHRQGCQGVDHGTRLGVAVAALASEETSVFMTAVVTLLVCTGYGELAIRGACRASATCRANARFVYGGQAQTHADALALLASEAGTVALHAVWVLLSAGVIIGPATLAPAYARRQCGLCTHISVVCAKRLLQPIVTPDQRAALIAAAVGLARMDLPTELVAIILTIAAFVPNSGSKHVPPAMPRTTLRGIVY